MVVTRSSQRETYCRGITILVKTYRLAVIIYFNFYSVLVLFVLGADPMDSGISPDCTKKSLLAGSSDHMGCLGWNIGL